MRSLGKLFTLAALFAFGCTVCFAQDVSGTVTDPVTSLPGSYHVRFPATVTPHVRDVFRVSRGGTVKGEAIVTEVKGKTAVLMPEAGFTATMAAGDTATFVRHAVDPAQITTRATGSAPYRAFSEGLTVKLIDPPSKQDMVFENEFVRIVADLTPSGLVSLDVRNLKDDYIKINWSASSCTDGFGEDYVPLPGNDTGSVGDVRTPTVILGHDSAHVIVVPVGWSHGALTVKNLLDAPLTDGPKRFKIRLNMDGAKESIPAVTLTFEAAIKARNVYVGFATRSATEEEKDNLLKYRFALVITNVAAHSPAGQAGLINGDTIVALDGKPVLSNVEMTSRLNEKNPGDVVNFTIVRQNQTLTVPVTLGAVR